MPGSLQLCSLPLEMPSAAEEMAEHCASHWGPLAVRLPCMQPLLIKSHPQAKRWLGFAGIWPNGVWLVHGQHGLLFQRAFQVQNEQ